MKTGYHLSRFWLVGMMLAVSIVLLAMSQYGSKLAFLGISQLERLVLVARAPAGYSPGAEVISALPDQDSWIYRGIALRAGPEGSWDFRLGRMFSPCAVIKKDGQFFLYYVGANGDRSTDGGP